jgi:multicomponent Na+:H+ antiporter subunit D
MGALAPVPVAMPLMAAAILATFRKICPQRVSFWIALGVAVATLGICLELLSGAASQTIVYWFGNWHPRGGVALGISFAIDPIGASLASLAAFLTVMGLIFAAKYFDTARILFHVLMLAFMGAMCGFALTGDIFNLFVFFELMSASAFALCGYKTEDPAPVQGALNFAVTNTIGAYLVLIGIGLLYAHTGALNMAQIGRTLDGQAASPLVITAFALISCGFLVKGGIVPFHFWLADAHSVAPTPVCLMFSGVMVELGLYAVARVYWTIFAGVFAGPSDVLRHIFIVMGCIGAVAGAGMCWSERNLKRLLAFSTIGHMGLMLAAFGLLNVEGLAGAALYALGHAGAKGGLFLAAGIVLHRAESVDEVQLLGRLRELRYAGVGFLTGAAALAATPFSGESAAASLIHHGASASGFGWIHWVLIACGAVTAGAVIRFFLRTYAGMGPRHEDETNKVKERPETKEGHRHTPAVMWIPMLFLTCTSLVLGVVPRFQSWGIDAAARFVDHKGYETTVLDGATETPVPKPESPGDEPVSGSIAIAAAVGIALMYLLPKRRERKITGPIEAVLTRIRDAQTGHVGDYVAWLTLGVAVFSAAAVVLMRR